MRKISENSPLVKNGLMACLQDVTNRAQVKWGEI